MILALCGTRDFYLNYVENIGFRAKFMLLEYAINSVHTGIFTTYHLLKQRFFLGRLAMTQSWRPSHRGECES